MRLILALYNPVQGGAFPDSLADTTGESGVYSFNRIAPDCYNVIAVHLEKRARAMAVY